MDEYNAAKIRTAGKINCIDRTCKNVDAKS